MIKLAAIAAVLVIYAGLAFAQESSSPRFGGPDAVENQLEEDRLTWNERRNQWKDKYGFGVTFDYTSVVLTANETFSDSTGMGGIARLYGAWDLIGDGEGALVWKFEHRHAYGDTSPFDFSLGELGYVGLQEPPFNDSDFRTQNFYWRQRMNDGRSTLIAGVLDVTDYVDAFALASPWLHFMNFAFSTGSAAIGLPNDASVGVAFGTMLNDNWYVIGGITDTNGDPSKPFEGFDNFFSDNEYFTSVEIGWTSSQDKIILDNTHLTLWHKDRQDELGVAGGWGMAFSYSRYFNDRYMPFIRGAYTDDAGSLLQKSLSVGMGRQVEAFSGLVGVGLNWGEPNDDTFEGLNLSDQYAIEAFYRIPVGKRFAITADVQYIRDPALNPDESSLWMLNGRMRFAF